MTARSRSGCRHRSICAVISPPSVRIKIKTAAGASVPLYSVADMDYSEGVKLDQAQRPLTASSPSARMCRSVQHLIRRRPNSSGSFLKPKLPPTVHLAESGDAKIQGEMEQGFVNAMLLGLMLVLAVLILLFKDVIQPFTILFSLPLAIGGVAVGADHHQQCAVDARSDRHPDADGHRHQERHPAGRFRHRDAASRHGARSKPWWRPAASAPARSS